MERLGNEFVEGNFGKYPGARGEAWQRPFRGNKLLSTFGPGGGLAGKVVGENFAKHPVEKWGAWQRTFRGEFC